MRRGTSWDPVAAVAPRLARFTQTNHCESNDALFPHVRCSVEGRPVKSPLDVGMLLITVAVSNEEKAKVTVLKR